jgi:hypothetical protein
VLDARKPRIEDKLGHASSGVNLGFQYVCLQCEMVEVLRLLAAGLASTFVE